MFSRQRSKRARESSATVLLDNVIISDSRLKKDYKEFHKKGNLKARWYSPDDGERLGVHDDLLEAFSYLGATSLLDHVHHHYPALTAEFTATLASDMASPDFVGPITFQLGNVQHSFTLQQFNALLGFPNPRASYNHLSCKALQTWTLIMGNPYWPSRGALQGKDIANPLFRIILRIFGSTIWAKKELSRPTRTEVACLRGVLFEMQTPLNLGFEFIMHVLAYRARTEEIWYGGLVTLLARRLEVDFTRYKAVPILMIDTAYLIGANVIKRNGDKFLSVFYDHEVEITKPNMDLLYVPNWIITWASEPSPTPEDILNDPLRRQRPSRYPRPDNTFALVVPPPSLFDGFGSFGQGSYPEHRQQEHDTDYMDHDTRPSSRPFSDGAGPSRSAPQYSPSLTDVMDELRSLRLGQEALQNGQGALMEEFTRLNKRMDKHETHQYSFMAWASSFFPHHRLPPPPSP